MADHTTRCVRTKGLYHPDRDTIEGRVLVFADGDITAVRDEVPSDADLVLDRPDYYGLPGLVDAHSHAEIRPWEGDQHAQRSADKVIQSIRSMHNLRRDLLAGTTTMRLMAAERYMDVRLAECERTGDLTAPRLLPSGVHLTPTGGHGKAIATTDGVDAIRRRIRENGDQGAHHVKYYATGGLSSETGGLDRMMYADEEVRAIMAEAHRQGMHVAAHAHGGPGARQAIDAGVDTIEHGAALDDDALDDLDGGDQFVVGTFSILFDKQGIEAGDADRAAVMEKVDASRRRAVEVWGSILDRDIPVAVGTDSMHGYLPNEISRLIEFGAAPERAIAAATIDAARACRIDDRVGSLDSGKCADLMLVEDDPRDAPETLERPDAVVHRGEVHHPEST